MSTISDTTTAAPAARAGLREWVGLAVLALPTLLISMDGTMLHLAVPQLSADLRPGSTQLLWIVDIYGFMVAGFLITMGALGDRIGRRRLLLTGAAAFAAASALAALATSAALLIAARALLGVAGATLMPSTLSLLSNMFRDPGQRRFAIAAWMTNFMVGGMVGPLVAGVLLERFWWGSVFLLGVPVSLSLLVAGPLLLPEYRDPAAGRLDLTSAALSIMAVLPVVFGLKETAEDGINAPALLAVAAGVAVGVLFARRQLRLPEPMLDLRLLTRSDLSVSLSAQTLGLFVLAGSQFLILQYFQVVLGLPPLQAGVWTLPAMLAGIPGTLLAPLVARWLRPGRVMSLGFALAIAGLAVLTQVTSGSGPAPAAVGFAAVLFGGQLAVALTYDLIVGSAPPERAGAASGMGETGTELGMALGVAVAGSTATAVYRSQVTVDALPAGISPDVLQAARDTLGGAAAVAGQLPGSLGRDLLAVAQEAFTHGVRLTAVLNAVILAALAIATATLVHDREPAGGEAAMGEAAMDEDPAQHSGQGEDADRSIQGCLQS